MTYLRNCVCFKGSLSAFPFASFCGGGFAGWSLLAVPRHQVSLALAIRSHPETLTIQSPGPPWPMGANHARAVFPTQLSALGFTFTRLCTAVYLATIILLPRSDLQELSVLSKRNDAIRGRRSLSELAVLCAKWSSTQIFPRLVLLLLSRLITCPFISRQVTDTVQTPLGTCPSCSIQATNSPGP